jgi:FixJ family two-component response regulator
MISVVHVDNSKFFRKVMTAFLAGLGMSCESYELGEDVLDAVHTRKVSCVITGLELADMSGEDLIRQLLFSAHPMTIIAVTAIGDDERIERLANLGVKATIQKGGNWKEKLREYL